MLRCGDSFDFGEGATRTIIIRKGVPGIKVQEQLSTYPSGEQYRTKLESVRLRGLLFGGFSSGSFLSPFLSFVLPMFIPFFFFHFL